MNLSDIYVPSVAEFTQHMDSKKELSKILKVGDNAIAWMGYLEGKTGYIIKEDDTHFIIKCDLFNNGEPIECRERKEYFNSVK